MTRADKAKVFAKIAEALEQTGELEGGCGLCHAAFRMGVTDAYELIPNIFGYAHWGEYESPKANELRVIGAQFAACFLEVSA